MDKTTTNNINNNDNDYDTTTNLENTITNNNDNNDNNDMIILRMSISALISNKTPCFAGFVYRFVAAGRTKGWCGSGGGRGGGTVSFGSYCIVLYCVVQQVSALCCDGQSHLPVNQVHVCLNIDSANTCTVSFHNFKSQILKLSVSNPKSQYVAYVSVLSQISNCQGLG